MGAAFLTLRCHHPESSYLRSRPLCDTFMKWLVPLKGKQTRCPTMRFWINTWKGYAKFGKKSNVPHISHENFLFRNFKNHQSGLKMHQAIQQTSMEWNTSIKNIFPEILPGKHLPWNWFQQKGCKRLNEGYNFFLYSSEKRPKESDDFLFSVP